jgi:heme exporter protein C
MPTTGRNPGANAVARPTGLVDLANPTRFLSLTRLAIPYLAAAAAILLAVGLYWSLTAPDDYQQGATVLIMFVHVPAAWLAMMCYAVMSVSALGVLVWRHPLADVSLRAAAPVGAAFTFLALATGSLWGKPMWGAWWVWDARLTSVLVLLLIYLGLIALARATEESAFSARALAVVTLVGSINIPIIKFSVDWWNTLHQPASVSRFARPAMDSAYLYPLLIMALAYTVLFFALQIANMRNEILRRRLRAMKAGAARAMGGW